MTSKRFFFEPSDVIGRFSRVGLAAVASIVLVGALHAERLIAVRASAEPSYIARRTGADAPESESYVIIRGQQNVGADNGLMKVPFSTIVETLSSDLLLRNFVPAENIESADLAIAVHWGMTRESENGAVALQYDPDAVRQASEAVAEAKQRESSDSTGITRALGAAAAAEARLNNELSLAASLYRKNERVSYSNAELLGFKPFMNRDDNIGETLRTMAEEERYFVILVAYDARALRDKKKVALWVTRMSLRASGVNFPIALDRMSSVGAFFHGTRQPGVILQDSPKKRPELTKLENVIVIGDRPAATPAAKK